MFQLLSDLIQKTAWPMAAPRPYSLFHVLFSAAGIVLAAGLALWLNGFPQKHGLTEKQTLHVLVSCGLLLSFSEVYKQLFLYVVVNHGCYDWWYFPFQLCSTPMYLCLFLPFIWRYPGIRRTVCTYLQDFCLLGGLMALLEPSGLLHSYWTLTLHGLLWHILLIFIGIFCGTSKIAGRGSLEYLKTLLLLGFFCLVATAVNIATHGQADMFYISPYYPVTQIFFYQLSLRYGICAGIVLYLISLCLGGFLVHLLMENYTKRKGATRYE